VSEPNIIAPCGHSMTRFEFEHSACRVCMDELYQDEEQRKQAEKDYKYLVGRLKPMTPQKQVR